VAGLCYLHKEAVLLCKTSGAETSLYYIFWEKSVFFFVKFTTMREAEAEAEASSSSRTKSDVKIKTQRTEFTLINDDALHNILARLPASSFASAACVSKSWNQVCNRILSRPKLASALSLNPSTPVIYHSTPLFLSSHTNYWN
jgi:hypothetical protein